MKSNKPNRWLASIIGCDGRSRTVGYFATQEGAARAWDREQRRLGRVDCNFPRAGEVQAQPRVCVQRSRKGRGSKRKAEGGGGGGGGGEGAEGERGGDEEEAAVGMRA